MRLRNHGGLLCVWSRPRCGALQRSDAGNICVHIYIFPSACLPSLSRTNCLRRPDCAANVNCGDVGAGSLGHVRACICTNVFCSSRDTSAKYTCLDPHIRCTEYVVSVSVHLYEYRDRRHRSRWRTVVLFFFFFFFLFPSLFPPTEY